MQERDSFVQPGIRQRGGAGPAPVAGVRVWAGQGRLTGRVPRHPIRAGMWAGGGDGQLHHHLRQRDTRDTFPFHLFHHHLIHCLSLPIRGSSVIKLNRNEPNLMIEINR
ncbi:hypothetical protein E2C01_018249 [Portunus trituberculatus]|uniref:Uncharacterized protein n=1 Tax=Portunus trituberculatus TaxID=210409 RepID=A0A5B7DVL8_PORTR|nr:hypothetical protein [Portunus trituberculatus]